MLYLDIYKTQRLSQRNPHLDVSMQWCFRWPHSWGDQDHMMLYLTNTFLFLLSDQYIFLSFLGFSAGPVNSMYIDCFKGRLGTRRCARKLWDSAIFRHVASWFIQVGKRNWFSHSSLTGGSWGIFSDSSVTLAQWPRARDLTNLVIRRSQVRFRPKTRQLRFTWIWANRPSSKGSKLLFPVIKAK